MYLSGLTCTDDNFTQKAGAQRAAARLGLALVAPDTSPRGLGVPGEDDSYDFGTGAGFYLNATQAPWQQYRMYEYVTEELPALLGQIPGLDLSRVRPARVAKAGILRGGCRGWVWAVRRGEGADGGCHTSGGCCGAAFKGKARVVPRLTAQTAHAGSRGLGIAGAA